MCGIPWGPQGPNGRTEPLREAGFATSARLHGSVSPVPLWIFWHLGPSRELQAVILRVIRRRLGHAMVPAVELELHPSAYPVAKASLPAGLVDQANFRLREFGHGVRPAQALKHLRSSRAKSSLFMCMHTFLHFHGLNAIRPRFLLLASTAAPSCIAPAPSYCCCQCLTPIPNVRIHSRA